MEGDILGGNKWHVTNTSTPVLGFSLLTCNGNSSPGTFEHALNHLLDHELDLTGFDNRFYNDIT